MINSHQPHYTISSKDGATYVILRVFRSMTDATIKRRVRLALRESGLLEGTNTFNIVTHCMGADTLFAPSFDKLYKSLYVEVALLVN